MKIYKNKTENKGYAILFTVAVVGIISMITIGLSNAAYKQLILSSVARDSATAFYEADIASECALFADNSRFYDLNPVGSVLSCAGHSLLYGTSGTGIYTLDPQGTPGSGKCFHVVTTKTETTDAITTVIESKGYNICNTGNIRTVERAIRVSY